MKSDTDNIKNEEDDYDVTYMALEDKFSEKESFINKEIHLALSLIDSISVVFDFEYIQKYTYQFVMKILSLHKEKLLDEATFNKVVEISRLGYKYKYKKLSDEQTDCIVNPQIHILNTDCFYRILVQGYFSYAEGSLTALNKLGDKAVKSNFDKLYYLTGQVKEECAEFLKRNEVEAQRMEEYNLTFKNRGHDYPPYVVTFSPKI